MYIHIMISGYQALMLLVLLAVGSSVTPPAPVCRTTPLPETVPVSIGETVRFDLEEIFNGFNLVYEGIQKDHIQVTPKYTMNESRFNSSMNFKSAKIKEHGRFLGLISREEFTQLAIGTNHPEAGISVEKVIHIEDASHISCYDVDEIYDRRANKSLAVIDCGVYDMGRLEQNEFIFVDLSTFKVVIGTKESDVFVHYHHLMSRHIEIIADPFNHLEYMYRFYTSDGVDQQHSERTYVEIFLLGEQPMDLRLFDVIDHTFFQVPNLAILDYQIHFNLIYLLIKDHGLVQLRVTPDQRLNYRSYLPIKLNVQKFRVIENGFNDDLHVVLANDNMVYQFEWDVTTPATLVTKYSLMAGAQIEQILLDNHLVIVQARNIINDEVDRRVWIFSRYTTSYTNAFGSFKVEPNEPHLMIYEGTGRSLHLISPYLSANIRFSRPFLTINPVGSERAGETEDYVVKATSKTSDGKQIECKQSLRLLYIENSNTSILKTGLQFGREIRVDSPDEHITELEYEFFGPNITYNVTFQVENSSLLPKSYVDKQHYAHIQFPPEIDKTKIVYFEMYTEESFTELDDREHVYGLVQTEQDAETFPIYQIKCRIVVEDRDQEHTLSCLSLSKTSFPHGKVLRMSQMFSPHERFIALVFEKEDKSVNLYYLYSFGFVLYGKKNFDFTFANSMTGVEITAKKQIIVTFEYGKRIQVYHLDDLHYSMDDAKPIFTIDSRVMRFYGVSYFAPVDVKVSIHHDEVAFVKTKTGVMAININEMGLPELLFQIPTSTSQYDFEVNRDTLIVITPDATSLYRLVRPLSRAEQPFLLNKFRGDYTLNEYAEINSEGFFYLVEHSQKTVMVIHPNMPSTSVLYTEVNFEKVVMMDAVKLVDREILFVYTGKDIEAWVLAENPKLYVSWPPSQHNFTLHVSGYNEKQSSEKYSTNFTVIESDEATIKPTAKFNASKILKMGHLDYDKNAAKVDKNISLHDMDWFTGNVMHYDISCKHCHKNASKDQMRISLNSHVQEMREVVYLGEPVYDLESTWNGIYGQMFNSFFKTFAHNESVEAIVRIPTLATGEVCSKIAIGDGHAFVLSFCESGNQVNIYITSMASFKPFTSGPYRTEAKAVNHAKIVDNILMIVDNDDNPFTRAGGVYLYYLDFNAAFTGEMLSFLDYLDFADLQMEGFRGLPYIASADLLKPLYAKQSYTVFLTEARTGSIFAFNFELSSNKEEAIYLHRKMIPLNKMIPDSALHPTPLKVMSIDILDYTVMTSSNKIEFIFLLTVQNWHHIEIMATFDTEYDIQAFELVRLYERVPYPWELMNYKKIKKGSWNASYFAVAYRDFDENRQIVAVYELPRFKLNSTNEKESLHNGIPITRMMGAHRVKDTSEICFDFQVLDDHKMLFNDVGARNITELEINKELKIVIKNLKPSEQKPENISLIAMNHYTNFTYNVELSFEEDKESERSEIIWVIILVVGFLMIIGLIVVWTKQTKKHKDEIKESLLTVDPEFKPNYINRSSVDPESMRGTIDADNNGRTMQRESEQTEEEIAVEREEKIDADNPLEERIAEEEQK